MAEHVHDDDCDHDDDNPAGEALEEALELDAQNQLYLEMRDQNIELLKIAVELAGFGGPHPALKPHDLKNALRTVGEIFNEFYAWVDPEQSDDDEDPDDEDDE